MEAEGNRALLNRLAGITGTGYRDAFDKAMQQFNVEQGRQQTAQDALNTFGLSALGAQTKVGEAQRALEQAGIDADRAQFEEERDFPFKQVNTCNLYYKDYHLLHSNIHTHNQVHYQSC